MFPFYGPLKHQKIQRFSDVFSGVWKGNMGLEWVKVAHFVTVLVINFELDFIR